MDFDKKKFFLYLAGFFLITIFWQNFLVLDSVSQKRFILNTETEIRVIGRNKARLNKAVQKSFARIKQIEDKANFFNPNSELSRINHSAKFKKTQISEDLYQIVSASILGSQLTEGYFDITATPLINMYRSKESEKKRTEKTIGYENILLTSSSSNYFIEFKNKDIELDLGGIAKGFAVDEAIETLRDSGIKKALITCGSSIYALGKNKYRPWRIGIKDPNNTANITEIIELQDKGLSTSGDYEQFYYLNKKHVSHIVNPRKGLIPIEGDFSSVTVITDNATMADALSTAAFSMGRQKSLQILPTTDIRIIFLPD